VRRDGAAWTGGLNAGDEILQLNGAAPTDEAVKQVISGSPAGTVVKMQVKHGAETHDLTLTLTPDPLRTYQLQPNAQATPEQQKLLAKWLGK
jgi:predicted metalloprotease with PDZ domain